MKKILIIDDEIDICNNIKAILNDEGYVSEIALNSDQAFKHISNNNFDLVILDVWLDDSNFDGLEILKEIRKKHDLPIIIISGHGNIDMAVSAIKDGANEFIEKPFNTERLLLSVKRSIELDEVKYENRILKQKNIYDYTFVGISSAITKIKQQINKIAPTSSRVMIYGESGTGKDIIAKEIHRNSQNKDGPFIAINAALMDPENLETVLFGEQNSITNKIGYLEKASNGTLFIDEVGEMPLQTQAKILRVLTDKNFTKTGSDNLINLNCRIVCSSIKNLEQLTNEGSFRKDLFHRLNVVTINIPNLNERSEDIDLLIDYFSNIFSKENKIKNIDLKPIIKTKYINYDWPGNIRELRNVIERYVILGDKYDESNRKDNIDDLNNKNVISLPLRNARKIFERNYLQSQINRFDGNISKTAAFIGMERSALHRKLKQLGITEEDKIYRWQL
ncbi:sigma-54-dependent Fis family transcriptional regulator [Pelagibacterales bacterium SAG-MED32]|nr:sigma-54-dependent Fis family transcriptional regulator [Pelagibacterales bacterium SAG-MED32]